MGDRVSRRSPPWRCLDGGVIRRLFQLALGIAGFGPGVAMVVRARLGLGPWDVLHQGIGLAYALAIGPVVHATLPLLEVPGAPPGTRWPRRGTPVE